MPKKYAQTSVPLRYKGQRFYVKDMKLAIEHLTKDMAEMLGEEGFEPVGKPKVFQRRTANLDEATLIHHEDIFLVMEQQYQ